MKETKNCNAAQSVVTAYIINHTHWDREWFTTSEYTSTWILPLIDNLLKLVERNPSFRYFFDGQTLFIADLLERAPGYRVHLQKLLGSGALVAGPYYCQPDWRIPCGESLIRNLQFGAADVQQFDVTPTAVGWMVDCFGHISQSPQIHRLFGIGTVYVWRGVPIMEPCFKWESPNGETVNAINLFGGYRNLYGITRFPAVATARLLSEVKKLAGYYPDGRLPLFDGYDLDIDPEDPVLFYESQREELAAQRIHIHASSPAEFADVARGGAASARVVVGELFSGRYSSIFPGTLSIREYLKVMNHDCERILFSIAEPIFALASTRGEAYPAATLEKLARTLLRNQVHDCICGVSVDSVHEKMEITYRSAFDEAWTLSRHGIDRLLSGFASGTYAVSTHSFSHDAWLPAKKQLFHVRSDGVGVFPIAEKVAIRKVCEPATGFTWRNSYYEAAVDEFGQVIVNGNRLGTVTACTDQGDTYSEELSDDDRPLTATSAPYVTERSLAHTVVSYRGSITINTTTVEACIEIVFDLSPLIRWRINLDSRGTGFCLKMRFQTGVAGGTIRVAMPFDLVDRLAEQTDLLPRQPDPALARILLGPRELNRIKTFPFHDMIVVENPKSSAAVYAQGIRAYRADTDGSVSLLLRRSVQWLTRQNLRDRQGDAGPVMYVPDARAEREVTHEVAWATFDGEKRLQHYYQWLEFFTNPPLIVEHTGGGKIGTWPVLMETLPTSGIFAKDASVCVRWFNPFGTPQPLRRHYAVADVLGNPSGKVIDRVMPGQIVTVAITPPLANGKDGENGANRVLNPPRWRVGKSHATIDQDILKQMEAKMADLRSERTRMEACIDSLSGQQTYHARHRIYVLHREELELELSLALNRVKQAHGNDDKAHLFEVDPIIAQISLKLNDLRIKRRVYDYVIEAIRE
jgi:alpha-mannosidase